MLLLSFLATGLLGICVALVVRAFALPRMRTAQQVESIELYGYRRPAVAAAPAVDGPALSGLAQRVGTALARRAGADQAELRAMLVSAGFYRLTPQALLGYRAIAAGACALLLVLAAGGQLSLTLFAAALGGAFGWYAPMISVRSAGRRRATTIDRALPDVIDLLVVTVEAGMTLSASMQLAAKRQAGPLGDELRLTLQEQQMGRSLHEALLGMLSRCDTPNMRSFVRSVTQGENLGVSIGSIMRTLAEEMRKRRRADAERRAHQAPVKILFPLVFLILPAFVMTIIVPPLLKMVESFGG